MTYGYSASAASVEPDDSAFLSDGKTYNSLHREPGPKPMEVEAWPFLWAPPHMRFGGEDFLAPFLYPRLPALPRRKWLCCARPSQ